MKGWMWGLVILVVLFAGYRFASQPKAPVSKELRTTSGMLMTKTRDHEALWVHYSYADMAGNHREMSEKIPYSDMWEKLKIGQEVEVIYNDEGLSVLKMVADARAAKEEKP